MAQIYPNSWNPSKTWEPYAAIVSRKLADLKIEVVNGLPFKVVVLTSKALAMIRHQMAVGDFFKHGGSQSASALSAGGIHAH
ncbi:hypothetical protein CCP4SC76_5810007 [Gammaproteobacteria bacterium]